MAREEKLWRCLRCPFSMWFSKNKEKSSYKQVEALQKNRLNLSFDKVHRMEVPRCLDVQVDGSAGTSIKD